MDPTQPCMVPRTPCKVPAKPSHFPANLRAFPGEMRSHFRESSYQTPAPGALSAGSGKKAANGTNLIWSPGFIRSELICNLLNRSIIEVAASNLGILEDIHEAVYWLVGNDSSR